MLSRAIILAAALLASCDTVTAPLPDEGAPDELEYSAGGFGVGSAGVRLRGDTVVLVRMPWGARPGARPDSIRTVPAPQAWRDFWKAAANAGVRRWRPRYAAENVVDGSGWRLRLLASGTKVESTGSNAYPDRHGFEHELDVPEEFEAFEAAIEALAGAPLHPPHDPR